MKSACCEICASLKASGIATTSPMSAVSFCNATKSFRSGGITRRTACGITTNRSDCHRVSPSDRAAAICDGWMDRMPAR